MERERVTERMRKWGSEVGKTEREREKESDREREKTGFRGGQDTQRVTERENGVQRWARHRE